MSRLLSRHYTLEFQTQSIQLAPSLGSAQAARQLDIPHNPLRHWLRPSQTGTSLSTSKQTTVSVRKKVRSQVYVQRMPPGKWSVIS